MMPTTLTGRNCDIAGDPTEAALIELADSYSVDKETLEKTYPRIMEEPFDSIRKMMSTINRIPEEDKDGQSGRAYPFFKRSSRSDHGKVHQDL